MLLRWTLLHMSIDDPAAAALSSQPAACHKIQRRRQAGATRLTIRAHIPRAPPAKHAAAASAERPPGERIRAELERRILGGEWPPGHRIPSEHVLMHHYGCSRMTMNKMLPAMAAAGLIRRRRRLGSFVATPRGDRAVLEIQDFATEARRRGHLYRHLVLSRRIERPSPARAATLGLPAGAELLRVRCLHLMNEAPNACEDRLISLAAAPHLPPGTACLLLERRTWQQGALVTVVTIAYPGDRHAFTGRFSPTSGT